MLISKRRKAKKARLRHAEYYDLTATFDDLYERSRAGVYQAHADHFL